LSLEDLSLVSVDRYGIDGKFYLILLDIASQPGSLDKKVMDLSSRRLVLGTQNLEELTCFLKDLMIAQSKNNTTGNCFLLKILEISIFF